MSELSIRMTKEQARRVTAMAACPNCGLEAWRLEHRFCTHEDCPVLAAIATLKQEAAPRAE